MQLQVLKNHLIMIFLYSDRIIFSGAGPVQIQSMEMWCETVSLLIYVVQAAAFRLATSENLCVF